MECAEGIVSRSEEAEGECMIPCRHFSEVKREGVEGNHSHILAVKEHTDKCAAVFRDSDTEETVRCCYWLNIIDITGIERQPLRRDVGIAELFGQPCDGLTAAAYPDSEIAHDIAPFDLGSDAYRSSDQKLVLPFPYCGKVALSD